MKKSLKSIVAALAAAVLLVPCAAGCNLPIITDKTPTTATVISYRDENSTVFSSAAEVVEKVAGGVVEIYSTTDTARYAGSGVVVGRQEGASVYEIVTNDHVIRDSVSISIKTRAGNSYAATLVATDSALDIAVLKATVSEELPVAVWGDSDDVRVGDEVIVIGNPLGTLGGSVSKGIISATARTVSVDNYTRTLMQTDAAINEGNSGGGLFNMKGQLVGIVDAKRVEEGVEGIGFVIPANDAVAAYTQLVEQGYITGRTTFNITVTSATSTVGTVVYITALGAEADENFALYDRIYRIDGKDITTLLSYHNALAALTVGEKVEVQVCRCTRSSMGVPISFSNTVTSFEVTVAQQGV